jgi:hypothetical protein
MLAFTRPKAASMLEEDVETELELALIVVRPASMLDEEFESERLEV